jgi:hypothetical protein
VPLLLLLMLACNDPELVALNDDDSADPEDPTPDDLPDDLAELADGCEPIAWVECGVSVLGDSGDPDFGRTDAIDFWPVSQGNYRGPEVAYAWEAEFTGSVTWRMLHPRPTEVDHDLFVLNDTCSADSATARGFNDVVFSVTEGEIVLLVLDGYNGDIGEYEALLECD